MWLEGGAVRMSRRAGTMFIREFSNRRIAWRVVFTMV
jgi:hypothetical protein